MGRLSNHIMKKNIRILMAAGTAIWLSAASCTERKAETPEPDSGKLEILRHVRPDSVMDYYDLSGDSLTEFPDLSRYVIRSLDLSHNLLDTLPSGYLPRGLERLDLSHNRLAGEVKLDSCPFPVLRELDLSHNRLVGFMSDIPFRKLILAHNRLDYHVRLSASQYLDLSHNPHMYRHLPFEPTLADTFICTGCPYLDSYYKEPWKDWLERLDIIRMYNEARQLATHHSHNPDSLRKALNLAEMTIRAADFERHRACRDHILKLLRECDTTPIPTD